LKIGLFLHNDVYERDILSDFGMKILEFFMINRNISYIIGCFFELYEKVPLKMVSVVMFFEHRL
jgi:hypothetical protein